MSKKSRKNRENADVATAEATEAAVTTHEDAVIETAEDAAVETVADAPAAEADANAEAAKPPAPVFSLVDGVDLKVRPGFETVLFAELANGGGTTVELVDRMLASGEFYRVAPAAATKRPFKPTNYLLRAWAAAGAVAVDGAVAGPITQEVADKVTELATA